MALITCKDCKKKFSTDAKRCPHCGANKPAGKGCLVFVIGIMALGILGEAQDVKPPGQSNGCEDKWKSCRDNEDMANHFKDWSRITVACKMAAESSARYGTPEFPWLPFGSFRKGRDYVDTGIVQVYEEEARFQNGFGAMVHSSVTCTYDLNADKVLDIQIMPN